MATILVVDDERAITDFIRDALSEEGYGVAVCHDGATALSQIRIAPPDLVVLDIGLPVVAGDIVLREVRGGGQTQLPIIVATATINVEQFLSAGADDVLRKPFTLERLISAVAALIDRERQVGAITNKAA